MIARACLFVCCKHTDKHGKTRRYPYSPTYSHSGAHLCLCTAPFDHWLAMHWWLLCQNVTHSVTLWHLCHFSISQSVRWRNKKLTLDFCHGGAEERRPYWCGGCRRPSLGRLRPIEWPQYSGLSKGLIVASAEAHHWATGPHQRLLLRFIHKQSSGSKINSQ